MSLFQELVTESKVKEAPGIVGWVVGEMEMIETIPFTSQCKKIHIKDGRCQRQFLSMIPGDKNQSRARDKDSEMTGLITF
ncbi:MAG: hypothetical protein CM15mP10_0980 [Actinomycetota bacterium]|nr:MAG: hypothetical protein CM15mP10_0980 [Actinomycetota bacterium]